MSFEFNPADRKRLQYEAGGKSVFQFPSANLFIGMNLLQALKVNIVTDTAANAPDFQVFNAIQRLELIKGTDTVWSISGQALAAYFSDHRGAVAEGNTTVAGAVANGVTAQHFLKVPFHPKDSLRPWDFAVDTRKHEYELHITWRDLTVAGTLFGTIDGTITVDEANCYLDVELEKLALRPNPMNGAADSLSAATPLLLGIHEVSDNVTGDTPSFAVAVPEFKNFRNIVFYTTHEANTKQEVGVNTVLDDKILLADTQDHVYQHRKAKFVREDTSLRWGQGSNTPDGIYDMHLTKFGSVADVVASDQVRKLKTSMSVKKQTNATKVRTIFITQANQ